MAKYAGEGKAAQGAGAQGKAASDEERIRKLADEADTMEGFEGISAQTMSVPFVRILQKLSPQLDKNKPEFIQGAEEGQWFNTASKRVLGSTARLIVLRYERLFLEWRPDRGGFAGAHAPENAERLATPETVGVFGGWKRANGNSLQENYVYMVADADHLEDGLAIVSLFSSGLKCAKEWNRLLVTHVMSDGNRAKPYYLVWALGTEYRKNDKGTWYAPTVKFESYVTAQMLLAAREQRKALPPAVRVDYAQIEAPQESEGGDPKNF